MQCGLYLLYDMPFWPCNQKNGKINLNPVSILSIVKMFFIFNIKQNKLKTSRINSFPIILWYTPAHTHTLLDPSIWVRPGGTGTCKHTQTHVLITTCRVLCRYPLSVVVCWPSRPCRLQPTVRKGLVHSPPIHHEVASIWVSTDRKLFACVSVCEWV